MAEHQRQMVQTAKHALEDPIFLNLLRGSAGLPYDTPLRADKMLRALTHTDVSLTPAERKILVSLEEGVDKVVRNFNCPRNRICEDTGKFAESALVYIKENNRVARAVAYYLETAVGYEKWNQMVLGPASAHHLEATKAQLPPKNVINKRVASRALFVVGPALAVGSARANGESISEAAMNEATWLVPPWFLATSLGAADAPIPVSNAGSILAKPLHEQMDLRKQALQNNVKLNRKMNLDFPFIKSMTCQKEAGSNLLTASLVVVPESEDLRIDSNEQIDEKNLRLQKINFASDGSVREATTSTLSGSVSYKLDFESGMPQMILELHL